MIAEGKYVATPIKAELATTSKGTDYVGVTFTVEGQGEKIVWSGWLTDKTTDRTLEALRTMGWEGEEITELATVNRTVNITVSHEEYNGEVRPRVQWINPVRAHMAADAKKALSDKIRERIRAQRGESAQANPPPHGEQPPSFPDELDDLHARGVM